MPRLYPLADRIIHRAQKADVIGVVVSAIEPKFYSKAFNLSERFPNFVWVTLGLHPPRATPKLVKRCLRLMQENAEKILAIGEVGLDYYWVKEGQKRDYQQEAFIEFIHLAKELDLPVIVHSREAEAAAIQVLQKEGVHRVQLHCFNDPKHVSEAAAQAWYMSIPTSVVTRHRMQRIVSAMPLENMLLETDAPYLSPVPGQQNEPANLPYAVIKIAELKATTPEVVAKMTLKNTLTLFRLKRWANGVHRE